MVVEGMRPGAAKTGGPLGNFDIGAVSELPGDGAGYPRSVTYGDSSPKGWSL